MSNLRKLVVNLITGIAILAINFCWILPAAAVTQQMQIVSGDGYRVKTVFSYDEATKSKAASKPELAIAEKGKGTTQAIDSMTVSFFDSDGEMLASYDNIIDGTVQGNYFEFNYNPITQQLLGKIDLGGESAGEMYLKGDIEQGLHLIEVTASGEEEIMDNGQWTVYSNK